MARIVGKDSTIRGGWIPHVIPSAAQNLGLSVVQDLGFGVGAIVQRENNPFAAGQFRFESEWLHQDIGLGKLAVLASGL